MIFGQFKHPSAEAVHSPHGKVVRRVWGSKFRFVLHQPGGAIRRPRTSKVDQLLFRVKLGERLHQNVDVNVNVVVDVTQPAVRREGNFIKTKNQGPPHTSQFSHLLLYPSLQLLVSGLSSHTFLYHLMSPLDSNNLGNGNSCKPNSSMLYILFILAQLTHLNLSLCW